MKVTILSNPADTEQKLRAFNDYTRAMAAAVDFFRDTNLYDDDPEVVRDHLAKQGSYFCDDGWVELIILDVE